MPTTTVTLNGRSTTVSLTSAAEQALAQRTEPLYVELELYFSCLVKKFVHFRADSRGKTTVAVGDKLLLYFRPVTSTACTWDVAERLGHLGRAASRERAPHQV
jgi:hypothetical protein